MTITSMTQSSLSFSQKYSEEENLRCEGDNMTMMLEIEIPFVNYSNIHLTQMQIQFRTDDVNNVIAGNKAETTVKKTRRCIKNFIEWLECTCHGTEDYRGQFHPLYRSTTPRVVCGLGEVPREILELS